MLTAVLDHYQTEIDLSIIWNCSLNISVPVLVKGSTMKSHQYNDDGKQVEIFSLSIVTLGVIIRSSAASCGAAASAACPSCLPVLGH